MQSRYYLQDNELSSACVLVDDDTLPGPGECHEELPAIPSEFGLLTDMTAYLLLNDNDLCGRLPKGVARLVNASTMVGADIRTGNRIGTDCLAPSPVPTPEPSLEPTPAPTAIPTNFFVLSAFYASSGGDGGGDETTNWLKEHTMPCTGSWYGILCDGTGTESIVRIDLEGNRITGTIP